MGSSGRRGATPRPCSRTTETLGKPDVVNENVSVEVDRTDISKTRVVSSPAAALAEGAVRFHVERFALTANTTTYALVGDMLGYWGFFPTEAGWGLVPAIGWGRVIESNRSDVPVGGRYFGWYPMSRTVDLEVSATAEGVRDEGAHREPHAAVYRSFLRTDRDPFHQPGDDAEDRHALLRGLFLTSFLADDFFGAADYFGASRVVVLSASSKTGIGFAERASARPGLEVVGLTSKRNEAFVRDLGCYGRVMTYDELEALPDDVDSVSIDMAGNPAILAALHDRLGDRLRYSMVVGKSHADAPQHAPPSRGPQPVMFFAPSQVQKRIKDWGRDGYQARTREGLHAFIDGSARWMTVHRAEGAEAVVATWLDTLAGRVPPASGRIVSLG